MTNFATADHPRVADGTFTEKPQSLPDIMLLSPADAARQNYEDAADAAHTARIAAEVAAADAAIAIVGAVLPNADSITTGRHNDGPTYLVEVYDKDRNLIWVRPEGRQHSYIVEIDRMMARAGNQARELYHRTINE